tara:strand:- start:215 stop:1096 length:882 start_codon:yes stop_codon:yes gene_type:complete
MQYILGTAQFGLDYGVSNKLGKIRDEEIKNILICAKEYGVQYLDTANAYGDSEEKIGELSSLTNSFKIITKTAHLDSFVRSSEKTKFLKSQLLKSLEKLQRSYVDTLLVHNSYDINASGGSRFYDCLMEIKSSGYAKKIGVSVYHREELDVILEKYPFDVVQFPINVFNQTFNFNEYLHELKQKNIELHARSVFLQGLLLMSMNDINGYFNPIKPIIRKYFDFVKSTGLDKVSASLNFIKQINCLDAVVFGVQRSCELEEILDALESNCIQLDYSDFASDNDKMINPSNWKIH